MYKELIDVPLIIFDSSLSEGQVSDTLVSTIDVSPTIVHLFGLEPEDRFEGHSLLPLDQYPNKGVFGEATDKHGSSEMGDEKEVHFYREGDLKIIYYERSEAWELYDLKSDPMEHTNIVDRHPAAEDLKKKVLPRVGRWNR